MGPQSARSGTGCHPGPARAGVPGLARLGTVLGGGRVRGIRLIRVGAGRRLRRGRRRWRRRVPGGALIRPAAGGRLRATGGVPGRAWAGTGLSRPRSGRWCSRDSCCRWPGPARGCALGWPQPPAMRGTRVRAGPCPRSCRTGCPPRPVSPGPRPRPRGRCPSPGLRPQTRLGSRSSPGPRAGAGQAGPGGQRCCGAGRGSCGNCQGRCGRHRVGPGGTRVGAVSLAGGVAMPAARRRVIPALAWRRRVGLVSGGWPGVAVPHARRPGVAVPAGLRIPARGAGIAGVCVGRAGIAVRCPRVGRAAARPR